MLGMKLRKRLLLLPVILGTFFYANTSRAISITADTIIISTIAGQASSKGVSISSSVYLAAGKSLTLQGAAGNITTNSSATASAFFGDGSHLAGTGIVLTATQTFTGSNAFSATFAVQSGAREIILSTSTSVKNIDISASGAVSFSPTLHNSSSTSMSNYSVTVASYGPCVAGSTLTITTGGGRVEVYFSGLVDARAWSDPEANVDSAGASFLVDGRFVNDLTNSKGFRYAYGFGSLPLGNNISFDYLTDPLPAGTHSFCLTIAAIPNPVYPCCNAVTLHGADSSTLSVGNIFYVKEIK